MLESQMLLAEQVQYNCHISDATHAGKYTLCIYLLKMREYFRWERGLGFTDTIDKVDLGHWLTERESLWTSVENKDYQSLDCHSQQCDPFDAQQINELIVADNLVYSAGYGNKLHPHFVLADLDHSHHEGEYSIYVAGKEYARDLAAPPAMAQGNIIILRRESFRRMLWEKYEEWLWNRPDNAMKRALAFYPFESDVVTALDTMTDNEINMALLHEIGEVKATKLLGEQWREILAQIPRSKGEIMLRAVKDHLADTLTTLPELLDSFKPESFHFYMANLTSMRKTIAPGLQNCYQHWLDHQCQSKALKPLQDYIKSACKHWQSIAEQIIAMRAEYDNNKQYVRKIAEVIEASYC